MGQSTQGRGGRQGGAGRGCREERQDACLEQSVSPHSSASGAASLASGHGGQRWRHDRTWRNVMSSACSAAMMRSVSWARKAKGTRETGAAELARADAGPAASREVEGGCGNGKWLCSGWVVRRQLGGRGSQQAGPAMRTAVGEAGQAARRARRGAAAVVGSLGCRCADLRAACRSCRRLCWPWACSAARWRSGSRLSGAVFPPALAVLRR